MEETIHSASANSFNSAYILNKKYALAILIFLITVLHSTSSLACPSPTTSFPISEDFEANAFANWTHDPSDDFDWRTHTGATTSTSTGPSGAYNGSYYAYIESTSPNSPSKTSNLISPCFSVQVGYATSLTFAYHMYGSGIGDLNVDITTNDGTTWTNLWTLSGDQGDLWFNNAISLAGYEGQDVKLRFNAITGTHLSDIAIDNVEISSVPGCVISNPNPGFPIDFLNDNTGWSDYDLGENMTMEDNGDGTMTISGSILNGTPVDFGGGINGTSCGGNDGWELVLNLSDRMGWTEFQAAGGSANLNGSCGGSDSDLDYWDVTGTLTGLGCNAGRTISITGPKSPYRFQLGNGGNSGDNTCAFGMSTWFDLDEGGTAYNADIYAFMDASCYGDIYDCVDCEAHWIESECAEIGANWDVVTDATASNDSYVTIQSGNTSNTSAPTGIDDRVRFNFTISEAGNYNIFGRVQGATSDDDSFWVRVNEGTWYKWNSITQFAPSSFEWGQVYDSDNGNALLSFPMSAGLNTVDFAYREDGALLDKIMVGLTSILPTGEGESAPSCSINSGCNLLTNSELDDGTNGWSLSNTSPAAAILSIDNTSQLSGVNSAFIDITNSTGTNWHTQLSTSNALSIDASKTYNITFDAKATANKIINISLQQNVSPYSTYYYSSNITITPTAQSFSFPNISVSNTESDAVFRFQLGIDATDIWIDNIILEEVGCSSIAQCETCVGDNLFDNPGFESGSFIGADVFVTGVNSDNLGSNWGTPSGLDGWSHGPLYWVETTNATEGNKVVYINNASGGAVCQGQTYDLGDDFGQISTCSDYRLCFDWASFNRDFPTGRTVESRPALDLVWFDINGTDIGASHQDLGEATANQDWTNLTWTNVSYEFSLTGGLEPPANATSVRVNISEAGGFDNGVLFDNTSLCVTAPCFAGFDSEKCYFVSDGQSNGFATQDTFYTFNYVTSAVEAIGPTGTYNIEGLAMDTISKKIYASTKDTFGLLDISTGLFYSISADMGSLNGADGIHNIDDADGMTYDHSNNIIWATERRTLSTDTNGAPDDLLFQIDPSTGLVIQNAFGANVGYLIIDTPENDLDDIAISDDGTLYAISNFGSSGNQALGIINKSTGAWTEIGDYGIEDVESLAFTATGQLIATTGKDGDQKDQLYTIDAASGIASFVGSIDPAHDVEGCDCISASLINLQIGDKVWADIDNDGIQDLEEPGVAGVVVNLLASSGSPYLNSMGAPTTTITDVFGIYNFDGLPEGQYMVEFILPGGGESFATQNAGSDDALDSDANTSTGRSHIITLENSTNDLSIDAGLLNANVTTRDCSDFGELFVVDETGVVMRFDQNTGALIGNFIEGLEDPMNMVVGSDDWLYVSNGSENEVRKYSLVTGVLIETITDNFDDPRGMTLGPDGNIYINNNDLDNVVKLDVATGNTSIFISSGSGGLDGNRGGIEFGPDGNLYVASFYNDRVLRYNGSTGAFIDTFVVANSSYVNAPSDLTFGPDGNLYVSARYNDKVVRYDGSTGAYIDHFVTYQSGGMQDPYNITFGPDGYLYVSSQTNTIGVLRYNGTTGAFIENFASAPTPNGLLFAPVPGCPSPCYNEISISNVTVSSCIDHPLRDVATVSMDISWTNPPYDEELEVTIGYKTESIDIPNGATSPQTITFNVIADGSTNNTITASWQTTTGCDETSTFNSPIPCSNDVITCDILYLCGLDKPYDGDAYDHGWIEYLDDVNGANNVTPILTKDESGMGTYDPMNTSTFINVNLSDYDLIIISATTEGHISSDLINVLKDSPSGLLNGNYLLTDDLGLSLSSGGTSWGSSAFIDDTNSEEIYNYDNPESWSGKLFTTADYENYGDGYLWGQSNGVSNTNHGISIHFSASDVLPGVSNAHGSRVSFGYHMNGIYANNENNGTLPSPVSSWFTPENHLTLIGKEKFDQAILLAAEGCCPVVPVTITGSADVCVGSTTTLSPTSGGTWTSSDSNIAIVSSSGVVSGINPGKVIFTFVDNSQACSIGVTDSITVNPDLSVSINFNGSLCLEDDTQLSVDVVGGTPAYQYNWTGPEGFMSTDSIIDITINGNYNVTVTDSKGCSSNTTAFVYEEYEPFIFTLNSEVCEGEDVTLSVSGASGGTFQWDANADNATTPSVTVTPGVPSTSYTVTVTNSIGCTTSATAVIDVTPKPTVGVNGPNDICIGATTQLTPSAGGIWTSSDYSIANVSNTGLVTGLGNGSATFTFKNNETGCFSDPTESISVNDNVTVTISGDDQICMDENPSLTASVAGGSWSSNNTSIATINSSTGVISPVSQGNTVITYTAPTTSCYLDATYNINIYNTPTLSINGPSTICEGSITYLTASTSGTWTSSDESVAIISSTGEVTGIGAGSSIFSFVSASGCSANLSTPITVIANPVIALTGPSDICINQTTTLTPSTGGVWISSNNSVATISNGGVVTGVSQGNASFTFIESTYGCVSENTVTVSVNAPPNITAPSTNALCIGETATITPSTGGTWASSNPAIATITNNGTITAVSAGSVTFAFTNDLTGCTSAASAPINVQPTPTTNFTGPTSICTGETTTIEPNTGGVWSSTNVSIATITNQGLITGVSPGNVKFLYTNTNSGCVSDSSEILTVIQPAVVSVSGPTNICVGQTSSLLPNTGGVWSSSNTSIATVTNAGVVTAVSPGSVTFIFQNGTGCNSEPTEEIIIDPVPVTTYIGASTICIGEVTSLSPSTGGTWTSSDLSIATITNSGVATAIAAGSVTLTYTNTSTGCSASTDSDLIVNAPPTISITGDDEICIGNNTSMSPTTGGAWISSNNSIATITAGGVVTGISAGDVTFTFIESASGCTSDDSAPITILPKPIVTIDGANTICVGSTTMLSPSTGGVWTSDNTSVATVTNGGVVTGVSQGLARFTFTTTEGCESNETAPVIVFEGPSIAIDGPSSICIGDNAQMIPSTGGTWTSADPAIATINNAGLITAITSGSTTFIFTDSNTGCTSEPSDLLTIEPTPVTSLIGPSEICIGSTTNMTPLSGGIWTSLNPEIATIQNNGEILGLDEGQAKFIFMNLTTGCYSDTTSAITVLAGPDIMFNGPTEICLGDTTYILPATGGTWESSDLSVATITNAGMIIGVSAGNATFRFSETSSSCKSVWSEMLTVNGAPTVGITGPDIICISSQTNLSPSTGGTWVSLNPTIATVNSSGLVSGLAEGTAYFQFTDDYTGCISDGSLSINVQASPQIEITGGSTICLGYTTTLSPSNIGIWTSSNPAVATVSNTGVVTGLAPGIVTFQFMDPVTGCTSDGVSDPITITNCTNHDFNVTLKDEIVYGDLNTNDKIPGSAVYGGNIETISKPLASIPSLTVNTDGTYSFEGTKAGKYLFKVPVCLPPVMAGCEGTLLEINVTENVYAQRNLVSNLEFTTTYSGASVTDPGTMVIIDAIANDTCVYSGSCIIDESSLGVIGIPSNGTAIINSDYKIEYTPNANFVGLDTIDYIVCLADGITCNQSQEIVIVNHTTALNSTVANDDFYFTMRETSVSGNVMQNDFDPEGETISVTPVGTSGNPVTIPEGSYYISSTGAFTFTPNIDFVGTANIVYTICDNSIDSYCTDATIHILVLDDLSLNIKVYLEGALMNNSGAESPEGNPLMRDDLRVSPFTGENYIPITDPYSIGSDPFVNTEDAFTQVGPGLLSKYQLITDSLGVFSVEGENAIVDWVHVELRSKNDSTEVFATRSGLLQRDGDVVELDGASSLRFQGVNTDSFYVVLKHRSHLGVMSQLVTNDELIDFTDIDYPVYNYGTSYGNGFDYDGLSRKNTVVYGYSALWAGDFDSNGKVKFTNPDDDQNVLFLGVLFSSPDFLINYDNAYGYLTSDFDMNSKSKYTNPNDDLNFLFSQILLYPLNNSFLSNFSSLIEQIPE